jgi:hypothetical protein
MVMTVMDNLESQAHKSSEVDRVPLEDLTNHDRLGFKLIPLREDSMTPNVPSTNEIYNNPEYWSEDSLRSKHHLFHNVATTFGKSQIKDEDGSDLYLNELDIDSDVVFARLVRVLAGDNEYNLIDSMCKRTYVVKTKKKFGRHIYWYSHKQNKPVRTRDCLSGHEFEIKTDNSNGHSTLPPSRHRVDPNYHYQSIGLNKIMIRDELYDEILDLLSDCLRKKLSSMSSSTGGSADNKTVAHSKIASIIIPAYQEHSRNDIIFHLPAFLYKEFNLTLEDTEKIVGELCQVTNDDELDNRLTVVRNTYNKAKNGEPINGRTGLLETLERVVGVESATQMVKNISEILKPYQSSVLAQLEPDIRNQLSGHIFEIVSYDPVSLVVAHAVKKQILTCKLVKHSNNNNNATENHKLENLKFGDVIFNATPKKIVRYENPLTSNLIKYEIEFVSPYGQMVKVGPRTPLEIVSVLRNHGLVYKQRNAEEALNAVLNAAQRDQEVAVVRQIDNPGFYYIDGKIITSSVSEYQKNPSYEDIKKCAEFLTMLVEKSKRPEILVSEIKWGILAPFSYVFKQLGEESRERWMPWLYLDGHTQTSKTTDGTTILAIYRKHKTKATNHVGFASANNIARLSQLVSHNTFPVLIDEVKLNPEMQADLVEAIKHAVQGETARTKLAITSEQIHIAALSPCILTSNHPLPADPALCRRFLNFHYPIDDKPPENEHKEFESFLKPNLNLLGTLGEYTTNYLLQNQEIITNEINDWSTLAKTVLEAFFKAANLALPNWIHIFSAGNQFEDIAAEEEQIVRGFLTQKINEAFARNYRSLESLDDQKTDAAINNYRLLESRLRFCLDKQLISFLRLKNADTNEILITIDILKEFKDARINFIQHFTDLARMVGAAIKPTKVNGKASRAITTSVAKLMEFISNVELTE